jgi:uncharacterized protein YndB with AHSA1/START domain
MPVIETQINHDDLTMMVAAEFVAHPERVWQLWSDPRQLERWWGPPGWPASFQRYDFVEGGEARYRMTGPEGESSAGWFRFTTITEPQRIEIIDGFAGDDGEPNDTMPSMRMVVDIEPSGGSDGEVTHMTIRTLFDSLDELEQVEKMGAIEGITGAINQIDGMIADTPVP